jgi:glycosyltransferase involved in cell wall biosynthesis
MDVLIVMPLAEQRGGGELMLVHLLRAMRTTQVRFTVTLFEGGPLAAEFGRMGHEVVVIEAGRLRQVHRYFAAVLGLTRLARRSDLVWSWMPKGHLYASPAAMLASRPAVWNQLGTPKAGAWLDRLATALPAAGVIALSRAGMEAQARLWPHRPVRLVYPGTDLDEFDPDRLPDRASVRAKLELPADAPLIGIVARLQRWKGIHLVIEAMPRVLAAHADAQLVVVGGEHSLEPHYVQELRNLIDWLGLDEKVRLVGLQSNVREWMHAMDVIVMASYGEPFGIVVIEAMALGKPVVASDNGGPTEIITPGIDGLVFKPGNPVSLADALLQVLDHADLAREIERNARARARVFSAHAYAQNAIEAARALTAV